MEANISGDTLVVFGGIIATVIAGAFSCLGLITSKEQEVSAFRQNWIDSLRQSVSVYISLLCYLCLRGKNPTKTEDVKSDWLKMLEEIEETYEKMNQSYNDIIFRINDKETDKNGKKLNGTFLSALEKTREDYSKGRVKDAKEGCDKLRDAMKPLLKREWKRVKQGEMAYRIAKWISLGILVVATVVLVGFAYAVWPKKDAPPLTIKQTDKMNKKEAPKKNLRDATQKKGEG